MPHSSSRNTFSYAARASASWPSAACSVAARTSSSASSSSANYHSTDGGYWVRVLGVCGTGLLEACVKVDWRKRGGYVAS